MKSLPEKEIFNQLENRLRNYTEMPDEDAWDKIAGALPKEEGVSGWIWFDRLSAIAIIGLLLFLVIMNQPGNMSQEKNSQRIASGDHSISADKNHDSSDTADGLIKNKNSSHEENSATTSDVLIDKANTAGNVSIVKNWMITQRGKAIIPDSKNQKLAMSDPVQSDMNVSALNRNDKVENKNRREEFDVDTELSRINSDGININAIGSTISINEENKFSDGATSIHDTETNSTHYSIIDSKSSIDSVNKIVAKAEDSLEVERKKRVPKELRKEKKIFKSVFYFTATPTLAYYKLTPNKYDDVTVDGLKQTGIFNANRLGFSLEAGYQRKLSEKLEVYGGLSYYQQSQQITYYYESADGSTISSASSNDLTFTVDPVAQKHEKHIDYAMKNVGVSAGLFYLIKDGRLQHKIGGGLQYQKGLASQNADATYSNASSSYFNYLIAYRLEWRYKTRTNFFIQPDVNHVIQSKEKLMAPFSIKPYRAGIGVGILYWF